MKKKGTMSNSKYRKEMNTTAIQLLIQTRTQIQRMNPT
jgi:hypothetical protein